MVCDCDEPNLVEDAHENIDFLRIISCEKEDCSRNALIEKDRGWIEHNVGIGRTTITADWEKEGWSLFVMPHEPPYLDKTSNELRKIARDNGVALGRWKADKIRQEIWKHEGLYLHPEGIEIEWAAPNGDSIHDNLKGGYYLRKLPREFFLSDEFYSNGPCDLIIENAHLRRRTETSLAQVYEDEELLTLFDLTGDPNLRVFEFPNTLTKRARLEFGIELPGSEQSQTQRDKSKLRDPEAILLFSRKRRNVILRQFNPSPVIEVENSLDLVKKAQSFRLAATHLEEHGHHDIAEILGGEVESIRNNIAKYATIIESMDEIRADYNRQLNIMRYHKYSIPADAEDNAGKARQQIEDALEILENFLNTKRGDELQLFLLKKYLSIEPERKKMKKAEIKECIPEHLHPGNFNSLGVDGLREILEGHADLLPEGYIVGEGLLDTGKIVRNIPTAPKMSTIMSIYTCVFDNEMKLRRHPESKEFIGVNFIWDKLLQMSQFHGSHAGVARANMMWYGVRMGFEKKNGRFSPRIVQNEGNPEDFFKRQNNRREWRKLMKNLIRFFRDVGLQREGPD
jgi:hypothetical protein